MGVSVLPPEPVPYVCIMDMQFNVFAILQLYHSHYYNRRNCHKE